MINHVRITDRSGLLRALNKKIGTTYKFSRYVRVHVSDGFDMTRLVFFHVNGVGKHIEVIRWNGPGKVGIPDWMSAYVEAL